MTPRIRLVHATALGQTLSLKLKYSIIKQQGIRDKGALMSREHTIRETSGILSRVMRFRVKNELKKGRINGPTAKAYQ
jgi:hypothetical protein